MVEDFPSGKFVTLIYAVLDPAKRTLRFASAGHLPPLLIERTGARASCRQNLECPSG
jgi:serine phosphatase RsbU (regulator of sigma subunit)